MSDSEEEEENFCFYGKPLDPYDEDAFPKKRPITVEEQIATDAQGRRRFHGAFTGGFSAGFFNTVGSLEGWRPSEFKSSRSDKAHNKQQKPADFMDDEDIGEFGFAPETVKATKDFSTVTKRKRQIFTDGPIPGEPVLQTLISSGDETVGYLLLKNIGLQDKIILKKEITSGEKTYGCEMPSSNEINTISSLVEEDCYKIPDMYRKYIDKPKNDTLGLGYSGLDRSHQNLFKSTNFVVHDKNKKLTVSGQAFGVGAFEEDDEDIYAKDDMSRYDFEMTKEKEMRKSKVQSQVFDMFIVSKTPVRNNVRFPPPNIPSSFTGKYKVRKSRFEPLPDKEENVPRRSINPNVRAKYLGEEAIENFTPSKEITTNIPKRVDEHKENVKNRKSLENTDEQDNNNKNQNCPETNIKPSFNADLIFDRFVSASEPDDHTNLLEPVKFSETQHGTQEMRDAARMKMFGPLTRTKLNWKPCALLCKRFNVPEPNSAGSQLSKSRKRTKHLIFQYQEHAEENMLNKPGISTQKDEQLSVSSALSEKDVATSEISSATITLNESETYSTSQMSSEPTTSQMPCEPSTSQMPSEPTTSQQLEKNEADIEPEDKPKELTDRLDIEQNIDLFKAVFLSSSESEDEDKEEESEKEITEEMKTNVLSDQFIPKIRQVKEGILSNIDYIKFTKPVEQQEKEVEEVESEIKKEASNVVNEFLYGPKLPEKGQLTPTSSATKHISSSEDEWVEKGEEHKKKKKKHKKKQKKEKREHKKKKRDKR